MAAAWLKSRRVFRKTWESQQLRVVEDYRNASLTLSGEFPMERLRAWGVFNKEAHLRFYRHSLLLPWIDSGHAVWLQARAPDPEVKPAELSLSGPVPCPYNARLLDGSSGRLYLCAGVLDTLELLEAGFPAVGVPEGTELKSAWVPRFRGKSVYVAFDGDAAGEASATKAIALLTAGGIEAHRLEVPAGKDVGLWMAGLL
jgi:DNA primase